MFKNTVKGILVSGLVLGGMIAGATVTQPTQANASSRPTYSAKRSNRVKLVWRKSMKRHAFHTTQGALYSKHLGYKYANMSAYPKTTWYTIGHEKLHNKVKGTNLVYYQVVSANGKQTGWVYRDYLKKGAYKANAKSTKSSDDYYANLANQMTKDTRKKASGANKGSKTNTNSGSTSKHSEVFNASEIQNDMLTILNQERAKRGLNPVTLASSVESASETRANQLLTDFNHTDNSGNKYIDKILAGMKVYVPVMECIGQTNTGGTNMDMAKEIMHMYLYDDASANWAHRGLLTWNKATKVGIGVSKSGDKVYDAINIYSYGV